MGFTPKNTIFGTSICPDEINNEAGDLASLMKEHWGEVFPLGGIGGAPFAGKTGFRALSQHVPDDGHVLVLFGPHVAISAEGEIGEQVSRQRGSTMGSICGTAGGRPPADGPSASLLHIEEEQGTLILKFSVEPVPEYLAFFTPGKKVPDHKFKTNEGKTVIMKKANLGVGKKAYMDGWCSFVKSAKQFDGILVVNSSAVLVFLHHKNKTVEAVSEGASVGLADIDAVTIVSGNNQAFSGVKTLDKQEFLNKGNSEGGSMAL